MRVADLANIDGRRYPAGRLTQPLAGHDQAVKTSNFSFGHVTLDPNGGQVPWHNQDQEEIYFIIEGEGEMCLGEERSNVHGGQLIEIPHGVFHQLTNVGDTPLRLIYCYGPAGDVAHWKHELAGTLPKAGDQAPPLPTGARDQITHT